VDEEALDILFREARTDSAWPCEGGDQEFPEGHVKTTFLCNPGHDDPSRLHPRHRCLGFAEACTIL
jgi:hypothetical protein